MYHDRLSALPRHQTCRLNDHGKSQSPITLNLIRMSHPHFVQTLVANAVAGTASRQTPGLAPGFPLSLNANPKPKTLNYYSLP